ncbi:toxin-antitoxin system HicB family antitoxin [Rhodococcus aerolatus]
MDLTSYTAALRDDLVATAALGDTDTRRTAAALAAAVEPAARLTLMAALSDLAAEVTATLSDRVVEVRLDGREVRVVVTGAGPGERDDAAERPAPTAAPRPEDLGGDVSRVTLRMFEQLKAKAEQAATTQGVSLNSWLSQAVQGALASHDPSRRAAPPAEPGGEHRADDPGRGGTGGGTLRGWVQG